MPLASSKVFIHRQAEKELDSLLGHVLRRFTIVFQMLEKDPYPRVLAAISGSSGSIPAYARFGSGTIAECTMWRSRRKLFGSPSSDTGAPCAIERCLMKDRRGAA